MGFEGLGAVPGGVRRGLGRVCQEAPVALKLGNGENQMSWLRWEDGEEL